MADWQDDLRRWREAGIVDEATADRIHAFEAKRTVERPDRPSITEALLYVGFVAIGVGAFLLGALLWEDLTTEARVVSTLGPGLVAVLLGALLLPADSAPLRRGASVAWLLAVPLLAGAAAIVADANNADGEHVFLTAAITAATLAAIAWVFSATHPQIWTLGASLGVLAAAIAVEAEENDYVADQGVALWAAIVICLALAWLAATELSWLKPTWSARILGAVGLAAAAYVGAFDDDYRVAFEIAVIAAGVLLVAASVRLGAFAYMAPGVAALFLGTITIIMRRVPDPVIGAIVVMLGGIALIVTVLVLAKMRPWQRPREAAV